MKTLHLLIIASWLLLLSASLPAQYSLNVSAEVTIGESVVSTSDTVCKADFSALPDSLTSYPFYYHFKDLSSGNINTWSWDFGDGSFSSEQHPSHQYDEPGTYTICLTVANQNNPLGCSDQVCQEVVTLKYFSLGGLVYAGDHPLNNPEITGDTGVASLYRIVDEQIVFVEDHYFQDYGYYWFGYLFPGEYLVKVGLTKGSPLYEDYFTTYYGDEISWTKADLLSISTTDIYDADIHLNPVQLLATGQGIIRGYVKFEQGNAFSMPPISQTSVILMDINRTPIQFTLPNTAGYFEFTGVPFDTYFLTADATGKPASTVTFTLSENAPVAEGINLTVFGSNANIIPEGYENGISFAQIYPNPIREDLCLKLYSGISAPVGVKIFDLTGKCYYNLLNTIEKGFCQITIPAASLPSGIYLLILQPQGHYPPVTAKFIK